jgi:hypothetical protein
LQEGIEGGLQRVDVGFQYACDRRFGVAPVGKRDDERAQCRRAPAF